jgi:ribokinase
MAERLRPIVVVGSINMDLVCRTPRLPLPGETVLGGGLAAIPGGKGANQAVAAARLGGLVHLVGRVGGDDFGLRLLEGLSESGVETGRVNVSAGAPSGVALILVDGRGENSIVVAPGANHRLAPRDIDAARSLIARASVVVFQLEIPLKAVERAVELCRRNGVPAILDPAPTPASGLPASLYRVDLLTPNRGEAEALTGLRITSLREAERAARDLQARGARTVVLKLGSKGALYLGEDGRCRASPPYRLKVVDTTAAGDAFTAALAVARSRGWPLERAVRFANAAGALACAVRGAQPAMPRLRAVKRLLEKR